MIGFASLALKEVLQACPGQRYLVITDSKTKGVGEAFYEAGKGLGMIPSIYYLNEADRPLSGIPEDLLRQIDGKEVATTLFSAMHEETPFRIKLIKSLLTVVERVGHGPGITVDMMLNGAMHVDYKGMRDVAERLTSAFKNAKSVRIAAPSGTDITMDISDRNWITDVVIPKGRFGNLPCGEAWCAPVEDGAEGILVCDGSVGDFGMVPGPLRFSIKKGRIENWECRDRDFGKRVYRALTVDEASDVIGELGIGLNPGARITGNLLEDEKAFKTLHIAFGNNEEMPGGKNRSKTHRDFLVRGPDCEVTYKDGSVLQILKGGSIVV